MTVSWTLRVVSAGSGIQRTGDGRPFRLPSSADPVGYPPSKGQGILELGSSTSTRTVIADLVFSNDEEYGVFLFEPEDRGLDAEGHGRQGRRAGCLAEDRQERHQQRLLRPFAQPLVAKRRHRQASRPCRSPLVQRPPEGRRAATQVAAGRPEVDSGRRRGSRSSWPPASPWSRTRSPWSGAPTASSGWSRWATIRSASTARASRAGWSGSSRTRTATAATTSRRRSWTACRFRPA